MARPAAGLRRVLQLLVHRHLCAAVRLPRRLPDPADDRARPQPARHPGARPAKPGPAAQAHQRGAHPGRRGRPERGGEHHRRPAARLAHRHPPSRRHRPDTVEISAEKGYLREFGNIVFHFSLLGLLVAVAVGKLFGYEGNVIVIADGGPGFCSASPAAFDSFRAGNTVDGTSLHPICVRVNDFQAHYLPSGQATSFAADIDYQAGRDLSGQQLAALPAGGQPPAAGRRRPGVPAGPRLRADLHGDVPGRADAHVDRAVAARQPADPAVVGGGAHRSAGRQLSRTPPSAANTRSRSRACSRRPSNSTAPCCRRGSRRWTPPRWPSTSTAATPVWTPGGPQSLFTLDPRLIEQGRLTKEKRVNLRAGQEVRIDQGPAAGTIVRFDGAVPFVNLQVSHDPGQTWVLVFAITMMAGLLVSLLVRRRRVWVRLTPVTDRPASPRYGERRAGRLGPHRQLRLGRRVRKADRALVDRARRIRRRPTPASRRSSQVDVT